MTTLAPVQEAQALDVVQQRVAEARAQAEAIEVRNSEEAQAASEALKQIARYKKEAEAERVALVKPLNDHVKEINRKFKEAVAPYEVADKTIRGKVGVYQAEVERRQREEQERLERERQERERIERERREKEEAAARAEREKAEREAREAQEIAAADADAEIAKLAAEAKQKAEEAKTAEAALAALPEPVIPKAVVKQAPKLDGIQTKKRWVVKTIALPLLPDEYKIADEKAINAAMRDGVRENGKPPEIPGVVFEQVDELAVRA